MSEFLPHIFGTEFAMNYIIACGAFFELFTTIFFFMFSVKKKTNFIIRTLIMLVVIPFISLVYGAIIYLDRPLNSFIRSPINSIFLIAYILVYLYFAYDIKGYRFLLDFFSIFATLIFTSSFYSLIINLNGLDSSENFYIFGIDNNYLAWTIYWIIHIAIYALLGYFSNGKSELNLSKKMKHTIIGFSVIIILIYIFIAGSINTFDSVSLTLAILLKILICLVAVFFLLFRSDLFYLSSKEKEISIINQILVDNQKQFNSIKDSIDVINTKTHDLKHQLNKISDKITSEELLTLKDATNIYDSTIRTGYYVLDAILFQNQLVCQKNNIKFTVLADGKLLNFIKDSELYALINNILSNAVEASIKIKDESSRIIDFNLREEKGLVILEVLNYFNKDESNSSASSSNKVDDSMPHGYGVKSIKYICKMYDGIYKQTINGNIFITNITFEKHSKMEKSQTNSD